MTPEGRVKAKINGVLKHLGPECWRFMPVQTGYGSPSLDYMLCYRGRFIAIEAKAKGKKLTPLQKRTTAAMEAAGALVLIVDDDDSLAIALQIMLFEEFGNGRGYQGNTAAQEQAQSEQHLRKQHQRKASHATTGGDHGSPRAASERQPQPDTGL
jgi:hypothetical protein